MALAAAVVPAGVAAAQQVAGVQRAEPDAGAAGALLRRPVTLDVTGVPIRRALAAAIANARVLVQYRVQVVDAYKKSVTLHMRDVPLGEALARILEGTPLRVIADGPAQLIIVDSTIGGVRRAGQADGTITGDVVDSATGKGLAQVTVAIAGTRFRTTTSATGRFSLSGVPATKQILTAKALGFRTWSRDVVVREGETTQVRFVLAAVPTVLSGVVTTAVGTQRRLEVGTDITTLNADSIRKIAPASTVTDLLENRVPGLVVQRQSGAPGAPARLRIRGIASIGASNDPIIVVDGVRRYSNQTTDTANTRYSVLDNIDVNSIATIDVLKGPSASALYGSDAANGVIVITTKRGQPGKTRWIFSTDQQRTTQPRTFPTLYYRDGVLFGFGTFGGPRTRCVVYHDQQTRDCLNDTVFVLNPLRDAHTTVLGTGTLQRYAASVAAGSSALQFFLDGHMSSDLGLLKMSDADVAYLEQTTKTKVPRWQRRPQSQDQTGGTARVTIQVTPALAVNLTSQLTTSTRSSTPLEDAIQQYLGATFTPADTSLVTGGVADFRRRTTSEELMASHAANADWRPTAWWSTAVDVGYQTLARNSRTLLRRGDCAEDPVVLSDLCEDQLMRFGNLTVDRSTPATGTANLRSAVQLPSRAGVRLMPTLGLNYVRQTTNSVSYAASDLPLGGTTNVGAKNVTLYPDLSSTGVQLGAFLSIGVSLFEGTGAPIYWEFGVRRDGSNAVGQNVKPTFPKLSLSYPISTASFFPLKRVINTFRLRTAYGHSAVQPALGARERTYQYGDGGDGLLTNPRLGHLGNPDLRPERSTEWEGGFDLGLWDDRVALSVTGSRKLSRDALQTAALPLSVGGGDLTVNVGSVRNTSTELDLRVTPLQRNAVRWDVHGTYSRTRNVLTKYAPDATGGVLLGQYIAASGVGSDKFYTTRLVEGYPLDGVWLRPVVRYADVNGDSILQEKEMVRADSSSFVGGPLPNYEASFDTQLGLWRGWVTLAAAFSYQNGMSQANQTVFAQLSNQYSLLRVFNDPTMPIDQQAAVLSGYAALHTVSALRFQTFSLRATMPAGVTRRLRVSAMSVALQGSNLGLWTNYSGADPNVSGSIVGNQLYDPGVLPQPRTWGLNVSLSY